MQKRKNENVNEYRRTFTGMVGRMYYYMQRRVLDGGGNRGYLYIGLYLPSREKFYKFARRSQRLKKLYNQWKRRSYELKYRPTPNRKNNGLGYDLKNLEFVTYSSNASDGAKTKRKIS